jgi:hypothetical protein
MKSIKIAVGDILPNPFQVKVDNILPELDFIKDERYARKMASIIVVRDFLRAEKKREYTAADLKAYIQLECGIDCDEMTIYIMLKMWDEMEMKKNEKHTD